MASNVYLRLFVCPLPFVYMSLCLSVGLSVCLFASVSPISKSLFPFAPYSICIWVCLHISLCQAVSLSVFLGFSVLLNLFLLLDLLLLLLRLFPSLAVNVNNFQGLIINYSGHFPVVLFFSRLNVDDVVVVVVAAVKRMRNSLGIPGRFFHFH